MYLPDPIEQWEDSFERWYFNAVELDGKVRCPHCDGKYELDEMIDMLLPPQCSMLCPECAAEAQNQK